MVDTLEKPATAAKAVESSPETSTPPPSKSSVVSGPLVIVSQENVEFGAGVAGAVAGWLVGGPFLALVLAALSNYGAKSDSDVGTGLRGISKSAIEVLNYLASVNAKYQVTGKVSNTVSTYVDELKANDESKTIQKVEQTLKEATAKAAQLSEEYDLVAKGKQALGVVGELADTAIDKTVELEKEYKVTDKVKDVANKALDQVRSNAGKTL